MEKSERTCPKCHGTGWIIQVFGDREGAEPCDCSRSDWLAQKLKAARIPELYKGCSTESFKPRNESQRKACYVARTFVENYPAGSGGLLFQGPAGVGKTHLATAVLRGLVETRRVSGLFADTRDLITRAQARIGDREGPEKVIREAVSVEVLLLDDLGSHRISDWTEDLISQIINQRYNRKKVTLFTTNYGGVKERGGFAFDREEIKRGGEEESLEERIGYRLRSRLFDMARLVEVDGTDYRRDVLARLKK